MINSPEQVTSLRIAIVEDDKDLLESTLEYLWVLGYHAWGADSAEAFYKRLSIDPVDVVVLDVGLPGEDGISVTEHLHKLQQLTVIIVSAHASLDSRLLGLRAGADRYLVKPVNLSELVANIETIRRRLDNTLSKAEEEQKQNLWLLSRENWCLTDPKGINIHLTAREFFFLNSLFEAQGETVPRKKLAELIFGPRVVNSGERLDVMLTRLRKKAANTLDYQLPVKTVYQVGYAFTAWAIIV